jgi:hypothetical protein
LLHILPLPPPLLLLLLLPCTITHLQVFDRDYLKPDDFLGFVDLPVKSILTWALTVHAAAFRFMTVTTRSQMTC